MPTISRSLILLLCPFLSLFLAAQEPAAKWENMKALSPGTELRVTSTASRKPIQGTLSSVTDSDLVLMRDGHIESFSSKDITRVSARQKGGRLRSTLIGVGVGTAAGALIGFGIGHKQASGCQKSGGGWCDLYTVADSAAGGASGLLAGGLLGFFGHSGTWKDIYAR